MFQMLGAFAEFERAMIRQRVLAGLHRARAQGTALGRRRSAKRTKAATRKALQACTRRHSAADQAGDNNRAPRNSA
jgi:DNA invertase Pin-like site-specific DNA recombinase